MTRASELNKIQRVLGHFKFYEMQKNVFPCFSQVKWDAVKRKLEKGKATFTTKNVIRILLKEASKETIESLHTIHIRLCAIDVSLHSRRRIWQAYELREPIGRALRIEKLCDNIKQGCRLNKIDCDVECVKHKSVLWFTLIEKQVRKNRALHRVTPVFCAYYWNSPYIFFNRVPKTSIMKALLHALLYKSSKKVALSGHDIQSLHALLKKNEGMTSMSFIPKYTPQEVKVVIEGVDATQHESRRKFSNKCFDVDTKLETLTFIGENVTWQGLSHIPNMKERLFPCSLKISYPNIFSTLKGLVERNVIDPEHCGTHFKCLSRMRKNTIKLKEEKDNEELMTDVESE